MIILSVLIIVKLLNVKLYVIMKYEKTVNTYINNIRCKNKRKIKIIMLCTKYTLISSSSIKKIQIYLINQKTIFYEYS